MKPTRTAISGLLIVRLAAPVLPARADLIGAQTSDRAMSLQPAQVVVALTPREMEVVWLVAEGCTAWQIAVRLGAAPSTIVTHIKNAYRKLAVHNAPSAVMRAMQLGLLAEPRHA